MGSWLLQHVQHPFAFSFVTRSEVYRPWHYSAQRGWPCFGYKLDCVLSVMHVPINPQCAAGPKPFALCLPHRGPVTGRSARHLRPLTFPGPANARTGSPVTCANQHPFSKPLRANITSLRRWSGPQKMTTKRQDTSKRQNGMKVVAACNTRASVLTFAKIFVAPIPCTLILDSIILCTLQYSWVIITISWSVCFLCSLVI